jgi:anti-sigma regulatory factor (Ser/Thr protein kinase)
MCWQDHRTLFCDWGAPRLARGFCTDHLLEVLGHGGDAQDCIADVALVVSELVTNAVNAECNAVDVNVALHRDHVQVGVYDSGLGLPAMMDPESGDPHGRGLRIVDELARSWGVLPEGNGKQVWAVLAVPRELTIGMPCTVSTLL